MAPMLALESARFGLANWGLDSWGLTNWGLAVSVGANSLRLGYTGRRGLREVGAAGKVVDSHGRWS